MRGLGAEDFRFSTGRIACRGRSSVQGWRKRRFRLFSSRVATVPAIVWSGKKLKEFAIRFRPRSYSFGRIVCRKNARRFTVTGRPRSSTACLPPHPTVLRFLTGPRRFTDSSRSFTYIGRTDCPPGTRSDNGIWRLGRSPVDTRRAYRTRCSCKGPTFAGPVRTRTACSDRPCNRAGRGTRNHRERLCTGCSVRKGSTRICPRPFL